MSGLEEIVEKTINNNTKPGGLLDSQMQPIQVPEKDLQFYLDAAGKFEDKKVGVEVLGEQFPNGDKASQGHVAVRISAGEMSKDTRPFFDEVNRLKQISERKSKTGTD